MSEERDPAGGTGGDTGHEMGGDRAALEGPDQVGIENAMDPTLGVDDGPAGEDMGPADAPLERDDPRLGSG